MKTGKIEDFRQKIGRKIQYVNEKKILKKVGCLIRLPL